MKIFRKNSIHIFSFCVFGMFYFRWLLSSKEMKNIFSLYFFSEDKVILLFPSMGEKTTFKTNTILRLPDTLRTVIINLISSLSIMYVCSGGWNLVVINVWYCVLNLKCCTEQLSRYIFFHTVLLEHTPLL